MNEPFLSVDLMDAKRLECKSQGEVNRGREQGKKEVEKRERRNKKRVHGGNKKNRRYIRLPLPPNVHFSSFLSCVVSRKDNSSKNAVAF